MRITSRTRAIVFFIALGVCLVGLAVFLNVSWIVVNWRRDVPLVLGIIFFGVIIAGVVVNTIFLVREIRRNEQQDSFLNAVTHELKTPIASIRLYLETLQSRGIDDAQRREFYRIMDFFLQINPDRPIRANYFVGAHADRRRHIPTGIRNADVGGIITNGVMDALIGGRHQRAKEYFFVF